MPIGAIAVPVVLNALHAAANLRLLLFAVALGLSDQDPAAIPGRALTPPAQPRHHPTERPEYNHYSAEYQGRRGNRHFTDKRRSGIAYKYG